MVEWRFFMNVSAIKQKIKKNKIIRIGAKLILPNPYPKYYEKMPIKKGTVLYESFYGKGITCGPKAVFEQLLRDKDFEKFIHIWVYDDESQWSMYFEQYKNMDNIKFVKYKSKNYYKALASVEYLINNSTFQACFIRKEGQKYINTWHGIPLKLMGYEMPNGNIESANTERNFLQTNFLLSPNKHHTDMYNKSYKLKGLYEGKIIETGQARTDSIFNADRKKVIDDLKKSGVSVDENKKIIMYAPTWKGASFSNPQADGREYEKLYEAINQSIDTEQWQILIKPHQAVYDSLKNNNKLKSILVSPRLDTNEILSVTEVLVSDYSSIFFDFLVTDRPIMFYIPDLEEYKDTRGLYMDVESLPGPATDNLEQLCRMLKNPSQAQNEKIDNYKKIKEQFCKYDDGHVSERIVNAIFKDKYDSVKVIENDNSKKKIFIALGRALQNGITHSFLSLLNNLDYDKYDVTAYLYEPVAEDQILRINQINKTARVLVRTGGNTATKWELFRMYFSMAFDTKGIFEKVLPEKYFEREAKRIAGNADFDSVVEFCGYSPILALILPKLNSKNTAIWQHNDLVADANRKLGHKKPLKKKMSIIFNLYTRWDRLVSCSHSVMEVNKKNLSRPEIEDKFSFAKNTINYMRVYDSLENDVEYENFKLPEDDEISFVTMGRLSTEKNHGNLVRAFGEYIKEYPKGKLYIIGEGPLRDQVEGEIERLHLEDKVILTGNLANPFTLMKKCKCFILPSIYEGQPMVLLEARIVGLPIVVSDFSSVKDSLMENGQYLINSSEESIIKGLKAFSENKVPVCKFDPRLYNKEAVEEFENAIIKNKR